MLKVFMGLLIITVSVFADYKVFIYSGKGLNTSKQNYLKVKRVLKNEPFLKKLHLQKTNDGKYYTLKIYPIATRSEAKEILAKIKPYYKDAYTKRFRKSSHRKVSHKKRVHHVKVKKKADTVTSRVKRKVEKQTHSEVEVANITRPIQKHPVQKRRVEKKRVLKPKKTEESFNIKFDDLSIKDFISIVSKATNQNILITTKVSGKVNFASTKPITKDQLYSLLVSTLKAKNLSLVENESGFLEVVKAYDAIKGSSFGKDSDDNIPQVQTKVFFLKGSLTNDIQAQVKMLTSKNGKSHYSKEMHAIIVTDYDTNLKSISNLLSVMKKNSKRSTKRVVLKNIGVESIFNNVKQLSMNLFGRGSNNQTVALMKDKNTNTITLVGNPKNVSILQKEIKKMDIKGESASKKIEMVYVKNADAQEIVKVLNQLVSNKSFAKHAREKTTSTQSNNQANIPGGGIPGGAGIPGGGPDGGNQGIPEQTHNNSYSVADTKIDKPSITFDAQLNAIILFGMKEEIDELTNIIYSLDVERQQVFVQAKIIEIKKDKATQVGFQYGVVGGIAGSSGLYSLSSALNGGSAIADGLANLKILDNIPVLSEGVALGAALSLLSSNDATNILSEPSILCINNVESSIYVGKTQSVISQSTVSSNTNDLNRNSYTREDIGLTLKIKPRISADNKVTLKVKVLQEDILPTAQAALPTTTKREIETTAIVRNAETIVIGGLSKTKDSKNNSHVPVVGNIPVVGQLFSHDKKDNDQTSLVILITPYIINHSSELTELRRELGIIENFSQDFARRLSMR